VRSVRSAGDHGGSEEAAAQHDTGATAAAVVGDWI